MSEITSSHRACTILIVDRQQDVCVVMADIAEHLGYHAVALPSGAAAIEYLAGGAPAHGAIIDICVAARSEPDIARTLREIQPSLAVLLVSADEIVSGSDPGSDEILSKPFRIHQLAAGLHRALRSMPVGAPLLTPTIAAPGGFRS
jgi:DNA-binding response OmpR family regulator